MKPEPIGPLSPEVLSHDQAAEGVPAIHTDLATRVLAIKEGETFLYSDTEGNLNDRAEFGLGLYHRDTRFLSHFVMAVSGRHPVLLSSSAERSYMSHVDLTNPDLYDGPDGTVTVPQQTLNIRRTRAIRGRLFERVRVKNYNPHRAQVSLQFALAADFADIFEVRGVVREERGRQSPPTVTEGEAEFRYEGLDGVVRRTLVHVSPTPDRVEVVGDRIEIDFALDLAAHQTRLISLTIDPVVGEELAQSEEFDSAVHHLRRSYEDWERECTSIYTDNELFNQLLTRGLRDLRALETAQVNGSRILAAGIPWYVAVFGRDSLITSHQLLTITPRPARGTLWLLARLQGKEDDPWRDEEPGKILHEIRRGEMANAGIVPFTRYYGSVDATPWFVLLYAQYFRWTGDVEFARELLPNVQAALAWIETYGDRDGDGFVEYLSRSPKGLANQGWKDSHDSVVHADGGLATGPIALAEVQGYVYLAKERVAGVFDALGDGETARRLRREAEQLKARFNEAFWMEDEQYFAMALDGDKRRVATITSNPGHCLYCDIVDEGKADALARRLLQPDMFSGWGIRTMSKGAAAYNPMSYHNGSVWPHDNALIAAGLKRYGFVKATNRVATALFDTAIHADDMRLPELFCGFTRRTPNRPVAYPVACSPQAWAAGAPLLLLQAILGISARAHENTVTVNKPHLPGWLNQVELRNLRVGDSSISLVFRREGEITAFSLLDRKGDVRVLMEE
jgi:glycogen debranching enzyme